MSAVFPLSVPRAQALELIKAVLLSALMSPQQNYDEKTLKAVLARSIEVSGFSEEIVINC